MENGVKKPNDVDVDVLCRVFAEMNRNLILSGMPDKLIFAKDEEEEKLIEIIVVEGTTASMKLSSSAVQETCTKCLQLLENSPPDIVTKQFTRKIGTGMFREVLKSINRKFMNGSSKSCYPIFLKRSEVCKSYGRHFFSTENLILLAGMCSVKPCLNSGAFKQLCGTIRDHHDVSRRWPNQTDAEDDDTSDRLWKLDSQAVMFTGDDRRKQLVAMVPLSAGHNIGSGRALWWLTCSNFRYERCDYCQMDAIALLIPCVKCKWVMYCSYKCQQGALKKYHNTECKLLNNLKSVIPFNEQLRKLVRSLSVALNLYGNDSGRMWSRYEAIQKGSKASSSTKSLPKSPIETYEHLVRMTFPLKKFSCPYDELSQQLIKKAILEHGFSSLLYQDHDFVHQLLKHHLQLVNVFSMKSCILLAEPSAAGKLSMSKTAISNGYYPLYDLFEYSETPNVVMIDVTPSRKGALAVRPIKPNEKLTIGRMTYRAYLEQSNLPRLDYERDVLSKPCRTQLDADCVCRRCVKLYDPPDEMHEQSDRTLDDAVEKPAVLELSDEKVRLAAQLTMMKSFGYELYEKIFPDKNKMSAVDDN